MNLYNITKNIVVIIGWTWMKFRHSKSFDHFSQELCYVYVFGPIAIVRYKKI